MAYDVECVHCKAIAKPNHVMAREVLQPLRSNQRVRLQPPYPTLIVKLSDHHRNSSAAAITCRISISSGRFHLFRLDFVFSGSIRLSKWPLSSGT